MSDVVSIQEQARRSFFQWHVLLVLKKKQLQATLEDAGYRPQTVKEIEADLPPVFDSDELALLQSIGLPVAQDLSKYDLPDQERIEGIRFFFHSAPAFDNEHDHVLGFARQLSSGSYEHRELLRMSSSDQDYLHTASTRLNQALSAYSVHVVFNACRVWSDFHGGVVMDWTSVSSRLLGVESENSETSAWFQESVDMPDPDEKKTKKRRRLKRKGRGLYGRE